ncbi:MAG: sensor histidine kinase [Candidatus Zixiibacteriota bacterium]|nr:MAG: sensor histidine kinase [candidate division Zixibacteria bacterium]
MASEQFRNSHPAEEKPSPEDRHRYHRLWRYSVLLMAVVSLTPLIIMTIISNQQYQKALQEEMRYPVSQLLANTSRSLESVIDVHKHALTLVVHEKPRDDLWSKDGLASTFTTLNRIFGGFVDLGLVDSQGNQVFYVGPYNLEGNNYNNQPWFHEVALREVYVSDVFMGYRNFPHFVIAAKHVLPDGDFYVLRATIDMELLNRQIRSLDLGPSSDVFLINRSGILQTNSRYHGALLQKAALPLPDHPQGMRTLVEFASGDRAGFLSYAPIERSPFVLILVHHPQDLMQIWSTVRNNPLRFLAGSSVLILLVVLGSSTYMVNRIRLADTRRARILHNLEYTNKMASIGRLAAGVAHEINNPISIINEKAGLLKDIVDSSDQFTQREKVLALVNSMLHSVERCSAVTHRLLGFARRMEAHIETLDLEMLLKEVVGFLGREPEHRNITIKFDAPPNFPTIESDRGQLQQVFLNIVNNALSATQNGGWIQFALQEPDDYSVAVTICDSGAGIAPEDLKHIFEPFFSTKGEFGTGLGLSITREIVDKLGGSITVESRQGEGTCFTVILPKARI